MSKKYRYTKGKFEEVEVGTLGYRDTINERIASSREISDLFDAPMLHAKGLVIKGFTENYIESKVVSRYIKAVTPTGKYRLVSTINPKDKGRLYTHNEVTDLIRYEKEGLSSWEEKEELSIAKLRLETVRYSIVEELKSKMYLNQLTAKEMHEISDTLENLL